MLYTVQRHLSPILSVCLPILLCGVLALALDGCGDGEGSDSDARSDVSDTRDTGDSDTSDAVDDCRSGETECGDECVNTSNNPAHCGACNTVCGADEFCSAGSCSSECDPGTTACGQACVVLATDPDHCGTCDNSCGAGTCVAGVCEEPETCSDGLTDCDGLCVNTSSDPAHCGSCGNACGSDEDCITGSCQPASPIETPPTICANTPISLEDTSNPDHVVGDGTAGGCTEQSLADAVAQGGVITFDCGAEPVTIDVTAALELRTDVDTIIDGAGLVTLDGGRTQGRSNRIFEYFSPDYRVTQTRVVLQRLTMQNAQAPAEDFTPQDPVNPECAWGYKDGEGGAIRMRDGRLHVIDSVFRNNYAAPSGPDTGGGAIYALGALEVIVVGTTFVGNEGSNGGAIGLLQTDGVFYNSVFEDNRATGEGQNFGGASGCPEFNHAEQGGAGGNAGAVGVDGNSVERLEFCGVAFSGNSANELGTVFRTPNSQRGTSTFDRVTFDGNHAGDGGGALWMQDMTFEMRASTVANNTSDGLGGGIRIDQGPHGSTILIENTTFSGNVATNSLGGGLVFSGEGTVRNCTFAENRADGGEGFFGAAIVSHGPESQNLTVENTIFWNNIDDHEWTPMTCSVGSPGDPVPLPGDGVLQWPEIRNGTNNQTDNPCTTGTSFVDTDLGPLMDNGGPTPTRMPGVAAQVVGVGSGCPATDQRGEPRPGSGCAAGAVEPQ